MKKLQKTFIIMFLFIGTMNIYSATYNIVGIYSPPADITWRDFVNAVNNNQTAGNIYVLTDDIGTPSSSIQTTPITQMINGTFQGTLDGKGHTITG